MQHLLTIEYTYKFTVSFFSPAVIFLLDISQVVILLATMVCLGGASYSTHLGCSLGLVKKKSLRDYTITIHFMKYKNTNMNRFLFCPHCTKIILNAALIASHVGQYCNSILQNIIRYFPIPLQKI